MNPNMGNADSRISNATPFTLAVIQTVDYLKIMKNKTSPKMSKLTKLLVKTKSEWEPT